MPIQAPQWTEFLSCPVCCHEFAAIQRPPISLGCGHTICRTCLATLHNKQCPFDQTPITTDLENLPINYALLQLVSTSSTSTNTTLSNNNGNNNINSNLQSSLTSGPSEAASGVLGAISLDSTNATPSLIQNLSTEEIQCYNHGKKCIEDLALYLKPFSNGNAGSLLSRPMQRKLVTLVNCQLVEEEGRSRALRAARSLGERVVTELILQHQNPQQLSSNLWAAVRARGCQFLGPAMQEEVLKLVLLALEDGSALSRKVLVMFVVQRLEPVFSQASKTSIGHVVQLLYRASCFKVSKREGDSSLMQLKEEFRTYEALRREHDAQIVQIATEAGLRIAPDQWSALLYGDTIHKSHMQSIMDKLQTPQSFAQSVQELVIALQRTGDPANLSGLRVHLKHLASIDPNMENSIPTWQEVSKALDAVKEVVIGLVEFVQHHGNRKLQESSQANPNAKYKISLCRDLTLRRICPRGTSCTFAHSEEELEKYRAKNRKNSTKTPIINSKELGILDYLEASHHTQSIGLSSSEETSPLRFGGIVGKTGLPNIAPSHHHSSQNLLHPNSYMDLVSNPHHNQQHQMHHQAQQSGSHQHHHHHHSQHHHHPNQHHNPSPIPTGMLANVHPQLHQPPPRHQYDQSHFNVNFGNSSRSASGGGMIPQLRSPRPIHQRGNASGTNNFNAPTLTPSNSGSKHSNSSQQIFTSPLNNIGNNFGPSELFGNNSPAGITGGSVMPTQLPPPTQLSQNTQLPTGPPPNLQQQPQQIIPPTNQQNFFPNSSSINNFQHQQSDYQKLPEIIRQSTLWEQQGRAMQQPPQAQNATSLSSINMNLKNPPIMNSNYLNSPNGNNSTFSNVNNLNNNLNIVNNNSGGAGNNTLMINNQINEIFKDLDFNTMNNRIVPRMNGNNYTKQMLAAAASFNNNPNLNLPGGMSKEDIISSWVLLSGAGSALQNSGVSSSYPQENTPTNIINQNALGSNIGSSGPAGFIRSDSILDDEYNIPFDVDTSNAVSNKFGPISRMSKSFDNQSCSNRFLDNVDSDNNIENWIFGNDFIKDYSITNELLPFIKKQAGLTDINDTEPKYKDFKISPHMRNYAIQPSQQHQDFDFDLVDLHLPNTSQTPAHQKLDKIETFTSSLWNSSPIASKQTNIDTKNSPSRLSQQHQTHQQHQNNSFWSTESSSTKEKAPTKLKVPEDTYEAGIANDMRELEMRLKTELELEDSGIGHT
ncbi:uncharacterized protein LOC129612865 [Condylostylus longicornis]|uniref:uncharacterized protein LOC129612865 n=1 Tax=Condylostylus longicornis TaxID=2530218 RepID=UPI00244DB30D|nr:uncharacterized protein LOC129612865 [Condylostylus longicornis]XP_055382633.1 uncharacterized protein LOC129612865 [Condylostylus longicornis]XP_055382634.1 uncharacterized protein LOC129612865 [Condylostylus longicornis]XP_055382636.1 uncharacterized protein LOC129612865 [Condylostylus longicornis]